MIELTAAQISIAVFLISIVVISFSPVPWTVLIYFLYVRDATTFDDFMVYTLVLLASQIAGAAWKSTHK
jgi:hypothetical protein